MGGNEGGGCTSGRRVLMWRPDARVEWVQRTKVHVARTVRAKYHTRALTLRSRGADSLTWLGPRISILTGLRAKAWCLLIHTHRSVSLSRGPGRKPGAPLYTRMRLPLTGSKAEA